LIAFSFTVKVNPSLPIKHPNQHLQIGGLESGRRDVLVKDIEPFHSSHIPLQSMPVFHFTGDCTWDIVQPIFRKISKTVRYMTWSGPKFLESIEKKEQSEKLEDNLVIFESCRVFSLLLRQHWLNEKVDFIHCFPNLVYLQLSIESIAHVSKVQSLFTICENTLRILLLDFNIFVNRSYQLSEDVELCVPKDVEVFRLSLLRDMARLSINLDKCKDNLKYLVIAEHAWPLIQGIFRDAKPLPKKLKYIVFDDGNMYDLNWEVLKHLMTTNGMDYLYAPCYASYASDISKMCVGRFPALPEAKEVL